MQFNKIRHNQNNCLNEFGLSISGEFEKVKARVLDPPMLTYNQDVRVSKGTWRATNFLAPKQLPDNSWTILCLDNRTREDSLRNLEQMLRKEGKGRKLFSTRREKEISEMKGIFFLFYYSW